MARHLSEEDVEDIVSLLDGWNGKLTWQRLCESCQPIIGFSPTRQTLSSFPRIKNAYTLIKKGDSGRLKGNTKQHRKPASLTVAVERIARLETENVRLKQENANLLQQFVTWQFNAQGHGITPQQLSQPLPTIDRDKTD